METVYFVNGFLEAGKTTFIKDLLLRESFRISGKTLILLCEEGEEEYTSDELSEMGASVEVIEDEKDFNEEYIIALEKKHKPERVIIEYNGMWDRKNLAFPLYWDDIMEITICDATMFKIYSDNMRSILAEHIKKAELIVFNRADKVRDKLALIMRNIKVINRGGACVFRGAEGDIVLSPDETLPYNIHEDELTLNDEGFAVMCMDAHERYEMYQGKRVNFTAKVYRLKDGDMTRFVAGRKVMTCCEEDIVFIGMICEYPGAGQLLGTEWVEVSGILDYVFDEELQRNIPVCRVTKLKAVAVPAVEILRFSV